MSGLEMVRVHLSSLRHGMPGPCFIVTCGTAVFRSTSARYLPNTHHSMTLSPSSCGACQPADGLIGESHKRFLETHLLALHPENDTPRLRDELGESDSNVLPVLEQQLELPPAVGQMQLEHVRFLPEPLDQRCGEVLQLDDQAPA